MNFQYTRVGRNGQKVLSGITRQAAEEFLNEDGRQVLVGTNEAGRDLVNGAMVEAEMFFYDDEEMAAEDGKEVGDEKGLMWNVYSVNEDDPIDIRDGRYYSDGGTPEEALKVAEEWIEANPS